MWLKLAFRLVFEKVSCPTQTVTFKLVSCIEALQTKSLPCLLFSLQRDVCFIRSNRSSKQKVLEDCLEVNMNLTSYKWNLIFNIDCLSLQGCIPRLAKIAPSCAIMISSYELGKMFFARKRAEEQESTLTT